VARWNYLRAKMAAKLADARAHATLRELHVRHSFFARFQTPSGVTDGIGAIDAPERNDLLVPLIMIWRGEEELRDVVGSILILGLWRDLDLVYQLQAPIWESDVDELESLLVFNFLRAVGTMTLDGNPDIGQSLVRAARRDTTWVRKRAYLVQAREDVIGRFLFAVEAEDQLAPMGVSERDLSSALGQIMGPEDVDLLVEAYIHDRSRESLAERFGRTVKEIKRRLHYLLKRLRRYV